MKFTKLLKNGIVDENPVLVQVIGMCPTLGVTTSAINGLGMGLSTTAVLICSNIVISLMRKVKKKNRTKLSEPYYNDQIHLYNSLCKQELN